MRKLENEWKNESKAYSTDAEKYKAYRTFYNSELRNLFIYQQPDQHKALTMEANITAKLQAQMEERLDEHIDDFNEQATAYHSAMEKHGIPDAISTATGGTSGLTSSKHSALEIKVDENNSKLEAKLDRIMNQLQLNNRHDSEYRTGNTTNHHSNTNNSTGKTKNGTWRKLNLYCWSHGVCRHNSADCNSPSDNHQKTATFEAKQGGSNNGAYKWGKWLGPDGKVHDTKDG